MKKILVPTDFSKQAENALVLAHQVALKTDVEIELLHILDMPEDNFSGEDLINVTGDLKGSGGMEDVYFIKLLEKTKEKLTELVNRPAFSGVNISLKIHTGTPYKKIIEKINQGKFDLVIMGTAGTSNWEEAVLGSNAERVVRHAKCPVLTVQNKIHIPKIREIAYASDFKSSHPEFTKVIKRLQTFFDAKIHLVKINTPADFKNDIENYALIKSFANSNKMENYTSNVFNYENEEEGIICFAETNKMNMIVMATEGRSEFSRLLSGSIAEDVVNYSKIPVLTYLTQDE